MKRVLIAGALTVVALCGYFAVQYYQRASDPLVAGIPPRENADGTVDYALILRPINEHGGYYWVIRLNKIFSVRRSEDLDNLDAELSGGPAFKFKPVPNNFLTLGYIIENGIRPLTKERKALIPLHKAFNVLLTISNPNAHLEIAKHLEEAKSYCAPPVRLSSRVEMYQQKNEGARKGTPKCFSKTTLTDGIDAGYLITDNDGKPIGLYSCRERNRPETSFCEATFTLKTEWSALAQFQHEGLSPIEFEKITDTIIADINKALVAHGKLALNETFDFGRLGETK
jgi:hypothetical protein